MQPGQTSLEINYTGVSLIKSDQVKFKYKLEGLEEDWVEDGAARTANYSYLPHGAYTFRVIAANASGVWNEQGAAIRIIVLPFYYETWWFRLLLALVIGFDCRVNLLLSHFESAENRRRENVFFAPFDRIAGSRNESASPTNCTTVSGKIWSSSKTVRGSASKKATIPKGS